MSPEEQEMQRIREKLAKMTREQLEDWVVFSRWGRRFFSVLGVGTCYFMLIYTSWFVLLPGFILLYIMANLHSVVVDMGQMAKEYLEKTQR